MLLFGEGRRLVLNLGFYQWATSGILVGLLVVELLVGHFWPEGWECIRCLKCVCSVIEPCTMANRTGWAQKAADLTESQQRDSPFGQKFSQSKVFRSKKFWVNKAFRLRPLGDRHECERIQSALQSSIKTYLNSESPCVRFVSCWPASPWLMFLSFGRISDRISSRLSNRLSGRVSGRISGRISGGYSEGYSLATNHFDAIQVAVRLANGRFYFE